MAKSNIVKKRDNAILEDEFDFQNIFQSHEDDEAIAGIMHGIIEASNNQMTLAVELTKLVVNKNTNNMHEEEVFSIFKKASNVIATCNPMKGLMEQLKTTS